MGCSCRRGSEAGVLPLSALSCPIGCPRSMHNCPRNVQSAESEARVRARCYDQTACRRRIWDQTDAPALTFTCSPCPWSVPLTVQYFATTVACLDGLCLRKVRKVGPSLPICRRQSMSGPEHRTPWLRLPLSFWGRLGCAFSLSSTLNQLFGLAIPRDAAA